MTPYDPPKPAGRNPAAHSGFLRNTGPVQESRGLTCLSRICATHASRSFLGSRCTLACNSENVILIGTSEGATVVARPAEVRDRGWCGAPPPRFLYRPPFPAADRSRPHPRTIPHTHAPLDPRARTVPPLKNTQITWTKPALSHGEGQGGPQPHPTNCLCAMPTTRCFTYVCGPSVPPRTILGLRSHHRPLGCRQA